MNKKTVVLVEDDPTIRSIYEMIISDIGLKVEVAPNGKDGLKLIEQSKPDLILLDIMMPIMTGDEMLKKLRTKKWGKNIPVIVLTNVGKNEVPKDVLDHNVLDIFVKVDLTPEQIEQKVKQALKI